MTLHTCVCWLLLMFRKTRLVVWLATITRAGDNQYEYCRQWHKDYYPHVPDGELLALGSRDTTVAIVTLHCGGNVQVNCPS